MRTRRLEIAVIPMKRIRCVTPTRISSASGTLLPLLLEVVRDTHDRSGAGANFSLDATAVGECCPQTIADLPHRRVTPNKSAMAKYADGWACGASQTLERRSRRGPTRAVAVNVRALRAPVQLRSR